MLIARKQVDEESTLKRARQDVRTPIPGRKSNPPWRASVTLYLPYSFIEGGAGFNSILFRYARLLLRGADERAKPNDARLREYTDSALPGSSSSFMRACPSMRRSRR